MKKLDLKVIIVAVFLIILAFTSYLNWELMSKYLMKFIDSKVLTFGIWVTLVVTAVIHYNKNYDDDKNLISDKEGLDRPIDYVLFVFTYGAIGTSIQALAKETFANYNFKELSKCSDFSGFDNLSFVIVIVVLVFYSYGKIKPIIQETYIEKVKIRLKETDEEKKTKPNNGYS